MIHGLKSAFVGVWCTTNLPTICCQSDRFCTNMHARLLDVVQPLLLASLFKMFHPRLFLPRDAL